MKEFVEKMIEGLEELRVRNFLTIANTGDDKLDCAYEYVGKVLDNTISIINELAEEYSANTSQNLEDGWIPCEKELPNVGVTVLCYYKRCDRYNNIISYYYELMHRNEDYQWISNFGMCCGEVIKWMPLPPVYKEGSE